MGDAKCAVSVDSCANYGCGATYNPNHRCQCNSACARHGNCCSDFAIACYARAGDVEMTTRQSIGNVFLSRGPVFVAFGLCAIAAGIFLLRTKHMARTWCGEDQGEVWREGVARERVL